MDNMGKFAGKGAMYAAARPRYAEGLLAFLVDGAGLVPGALVADVGSGTGIFSEQLLDAGFRVIGVEPNDDMREQAFLFGIQGVQQRFGRGGAARVLQRTLRSAVVGQPPAAHTRGFHRPRAVLVARAPLREMAAPSPR